MNNWIRNIQGQLSDLASEVLHEATEEVEDLGTEIQVLKKLFKKKILILVNYEYLKVERKKCVEAERLLVVEKSKTQNLEKQILELEEQLYSTNLENETCQEKFEHLLKDKNLQIKNYQVSTFFNVCNFILVKIE